MDGCWNLRLVECGINWNAWAAIGTLAAVAVALYLSGRDRSDRKKADAAEARIVASVALNELVAIGHACYAALGTQPPEKRAVLLATTGPVQKWLTEKIDAVKAVEIRELLGRLHLLPPKLSRQLTEVLSATDLLRRHAALVVSLVEKDDDVDANVERARELLDRVEETAKTITAADVACRAFLRPRWTVGRLLALWCLLAWARFRRWRAARRDAPRE